MALDRVRDHAPEDTMARMEHVLTHAAVEHDADFLSRMARRWIEGIDQDGSEPSEEELARRQGVFLRPARRGLYHVEIFATPDQYEPLLTVMNTATNPRTRTGAADGNNAAESNGDASSDSPGTDAAAKNAGHADTGDSAPGPDPAADSAQNTVRDPDPDQTRIPIRILIWTGGPGRSGSWTGSSAPAK